MRVQYSIVAVQPTGKVREITICARRKDAERARDSLRASGVQAMIRSAFTMDRKERPARNPDRTTSSNNSTSRGK